MRFDDLLKSGQLKKESTSKAKIAEFLRFAEEEVAAAKFNFPKFRLTAYKSAYDALMHAGNALIRYYGYRPTTKYTHVTITEFLDRVLSKEYGDLVRSFKHMRRKRHPLQYEARFLESDEEIKSAIRKAGDLIKKIEEFTKIKPGQDRFFELNTMKILVIGSGGREHALVWKIAQSESVDKIFCAPGNGGIADIAECVDIKADDINKLLSFAKDNKIGLTIAGPEAPLVAGIVDVFEKEGLKIFGPTKEAARLEASKAFAKQVMLEHNVPTGHAAICLSIDEATEAISNLESFPVVIKADGLAAGKGVVICKDEETALKTVTDMQVRKVFGDSGNTVVIEEFLEGEEASILVLTNGEEALALASSQDHKRVFDKDEGPNTGGMGAYSPAPMVTDKVLDQVMSEVIYPVIRAMKERGAAYRGLLYAGIMLTKLGPRVLEFNVRFGDPETQAVLVRLDSDIIGAMLWTIGAAKSPDLKWSKKASVCVVIAAGGYPENYEKGKEITGLAEAKKIKDVVVFHAGTKKLSAVSSQLSAKYLTNGGRVLGVTGLGRTIKEAIDKTYQAVEKIHFEGMHFRWDIGWRALKRSDV